MAELTEQLNSLKVEKVGSNHSESSIACQMFIQLQAAQQRRLKALLSNLHGVLRRVSYMNSYLTAD